MRKIFEYLDFGILYSSGFFMLSSLIYGVSGSDKFFSRIALSLILYIGYRINNLLSERNKINVRNKK